MGKSEQGIGNDRYTIIPRSLCFLFRDSQVLLLKGAASKRLWAGKYNGVGGHIERGEDILSAARREIKEETGLIPNLLWLCGVITINAGGDTGIGIFLFKGDPGSEKLVESTEGQLEWIPMSLLDQYPLVEDLKQILPRISLKKPGDIPLIAHFEYDASDNLMISFAGD